MSAVLADVPIYACSRVQLHTFVSFFLSSVPLRLQQAVKEKKFITIFGSLLQR
jgi:hypothetical protein